MRTNWIRRVSGLLGLAVMAAPPLAQGAAFTYQGQLKIDGSPAEGLVDMKFSLWSDGASTDPTDQVGQTLVFAGSGAINIAEGLFVVSLDFEADDAFNDLPNSPRWLQIEVKPTGGQYVALDRQPITAAPFSMATRGVNVDAAERVGIGKTDQTAKIHGLVSTSWNSSNYGFVFENDETENSYGNTVQIIGGGGSGSGNSASNILKVGDNNGSSDFVVRGDGKVGLGTDPAADLHVKNATTFSALRLESSVNAAQLELWSDSTGPVYVYSPDGLDDLRFKLGATDRMTILSSSGNVGIGKIDPAVKLHVDGGTDSAPTGGGFLVLGSTSGANLSLDNNEIMARNNNGTSTLYLNNDGGDVAMFGVGGGKLGLKTNTPENLLTMVQSSEDDHLQMQMTGSDTWEIGLVVGDNSGLRFLNETDNRPTLFLGNGGRVGIGTSNPGHPLVVGTDSTNGNAAHCTNGGKWEEGSSRNWKSNIRELDKQRILQHVAELPVLRWEYTGSDEGDRIGPMAEDFEAAFGLGSDNRYIATSDVSGVALSAIQALNDLVNEQRNELESMRCELQALRAQVAGVNSGLDSQQ